MSNIYIVNRQYEEGFYAIFSSAELAQAWIDKAVASFTEWVANPESGLEPSDIDYYRQGWYVQEAELDSTAPVSWEVENY